MISGSFAENDRQLKASYGSLQNSSLWLPPPHTLFFLSLPLVKVCVRHDFCPVVICTRGTYGMRVCERDFFARCNHRIRVWMWDNCWESYTCLYTCVSTHIHISTHVPLHIYLHICQRHMCRDISMCLYTYVRGTCVKISLHMCLWEIWIISLRIISLRNHIHV